MQGFPYLLNVDASLGFNLFNNENAKQTAFYLPDSIFLPGPDTVLNTAYYFKNFDLIRNAFLTVKPLVNIISWDIKVANTLIDINTGVSFFGSGLKYIDRARGDNSVSTQNIFSYGSVTEVRFRFNPKINFGVDLHLSYNTGLKSLSGDFRSITGKYNTEALVKSNMITTNHSDFLQGQLDMYFNPKNPKSSTDRGGFFLRLNLYKSMHYADGHFMFLAGYSSDIKNFFK